MRKESRTQVIINVVGGVVQDVFCSDDKAEVILVDWDTETLDSSEPGLVELQVARGGDHLAFVAEFPASPLSDLAGTDVEAAIGQAELAHGLA